MLHLIDLCTLMYYFVKHNIIFQTTYLQNHDSCTGERLDLSH